MSSVAHGSLLAGGLVERNEPIVVCDRLHLISDLLVFHIEAEQRSSDLVQQLDPAESVSVILGVDSQTLRLHDGIIEMSTVLPSGPLLEVVLVE